MKKIVLLTLIAMVPYFTMAQKRSKKTKETSQSSVSSYDFMVITGFHIAAAEVEERRSPKGPRTQTPNDRVKRLMNTSTKVKIEFDLPRRLKDEEIQLNEAASTHRTMVDAVQAAAINGWEFKSANVVPVAGSKIYYYYMERRK